VQASFAPKQNRRRPSRPTVGRPSLLPDRVYISVVYIIIISLFSADKTDDLFFCLSFYMLSASCLLRTGSGSGGCACAGAVKNPMAPGTPKKPKKWPKMAKNGQKWPKMAQKWSKNPKINGFLTHFWAFCRLSALSAIFRGSRTSPALG